MKINNTKILLIVYFSCFSENTSARLLQWLLTIVLLDSLSCLSSRGGPSSAGYGEARVFCSCKESLQIEVALHVPVVTVWSYTSLKQCKTSKASFATLVVPQNANKLLSRNRQKVLDFFGFIKAFEFFRLF